MNLLTAFVFAAALWATDVNLANTTAAIAGRHIGRAMSPGLAGILMALM